MRDEKDRENGNVSDNKKKRERSRSKNGALEKGGRHEVSECRERKGNGREEGGESLAVLHKY